MTAMVDLPGTDEPGPDDAPASTGKLPAYRECDVVMRAVAHDLRSPLNGIVLAATAAERLTRSGKPEGVLRLLAAIIREASVMDRLVEDLLETARIEQSRLLPRSVEKPADLVAGAVESMLRDVEPGSVLIETSVEPDLECVRVDASRIQRVLCNLMANAKRYSPRGEPVRVFVSRDEEGIRFSVVDRGPGVAPDERAHLFEPFWRGREHRGPGSGLGLSIARRIVQSHAGRIGYSPASGGGADVHFVLPVADCE